MFTARYILHSAFCPHSVFMCFVWIWEQTAIISLYSIDWLVFITETQCVYYALRSTFHVLPTQCFYVFCVDLITNSDYFTVQHWLIGFYNWDGLCLLRGTDWHIFQVNFSFITAGIAIRYRILNVLLPPAIVQSVFPNGWCHLVNVWNSVWLA